ncbi:unnamed protein product [Urochloa humidicola]
MENDVYLEERHADEIDDHNHGSGRHHTHMATSPMSAPPCLRGSMVPMDRELVWVSTDATGYLKKKKDAPSRSFHFGIKVVHCSSKQAVVDELCFDCELQHNLHY